MVVLRYYKGLIISDSYAPGLEWNDDLKNYVGFGYKYRDILKYFKKSEIEIKDYVMQSLPFPLIKDNLKLREYQEKALESWLKLKKGIIVLPTGSGKTAVALKAISILKVSTIIVVPTIDLVNQWYNSILKFLRVSSGRIGGGYDEIKGITVITYDSAYTRIEEIGNKFYFAIFDEVHHLPSEGYSNIAEMLVSPYRLGLTATPEREDGRHIILPNIVGPEVFRIKPSQLAGKYLSNYEIEKIYVNLTDEEKEKYNELREKLNDFLKKKKFKLDSLRAFHRLLAMAGREQEAREALMAWHDSLKLSVNSEAKIDKLREILKNSEQDKIIIFTRDIEMCYRVSREFLIPAVTYKTPRDERNEILRKFKENKYRVIVVSNVFDEGVDIPDANLAIVLGGYGSSRQFLQRLGRILRMKENKKAKLIEIITKGTSDYRLSKRRSRATV